ncbi:metallophosphoesterase [Sphingobacterium deserti]|uniref:Acid phosphatase n=1 Tax=Sphingobacterium deserti TaxID=1229276 RepID=A0A0B8T3X7_9SPHI|nr:metallophosphoesterase [Sphingobacterium deserti]KGE13953.1 acid phosphatase [Sphingobacterium deserti]
MKSIHFFILLFLLLGGRCGYAQSSIAEEERLSGYKGGFSDPAITHQEGLTFLALGDFGRVGEYHQLEVARELGNAAITLDASFIVSVGDNFYPNGVASTSDYHWQASYEGVYKHPNLFTDWFVALGNHDYRGNIQAQIDYSNVSRRWHMPNTYYSRKIELDNGGKVLFVVMDTNPFIDSYHKSAEKYPDMAKQDTAAQRKWLESVLADDDPSIRCKIVVGHHPLYSGGKRKENEDTKAFEAKFASLFDRHGVLAYICGHEHDLQVIRPKGRFTTQFLSGAGSEVRPSGEREGTLFAAAKAGFMAFTLTDDALIVQTIEATPTSSNLLHRIKLNIHNKQK